MKERKMEEEKVREHAEAHGSAVVAGDLAAAGSDLTKEGQAAAGTVMRQLPRPVTGSEVLSVDLTGEQGIARIRYLGDEGAEATVESVWEERNGRPKIIDMKVI
jgi:hypothetical protein